MLDKLSKYLALGLVSLVLLVGVQHVSQARIIGSSSSNDSSGTTPDIDCKGSDASATANELCQDHAGNFLPTTTDNQTLGTPSLEFNNVYTKTLTVGSGGTTNTGSATSGTAGATGLSNSGGTAATQWTNSGLTVYPQYGVYNLSASSVVPVNASLLFVGGNAASVTLTSTPEISTTTLVAGTTLLPTGTFITVTSTATGQNVVFTSSTSTNASGLVLGASTRTINKNKTLTLWLDTLTVPAVWREIAFGNN